MNDYGDLGPDPIQFDFDDAEAQSSRAGSDPRRRNQPTFLTPIHNTENNTMTNEQIIQTIQDWVTSQIEQLPPSSTGRIVALRVNRIIVDGQRAAHDEAKASRQC